MGWVLLSREYLFGNNQPGIGSTAALFAANGTVALIELWQLAYQFKCYLSANTFTAHIHPLPASTFNQGNLHIQP